VSECVSAWRHSRAPSALEIHVMIMLAIRRAHGQVAPSIQLEAQTAESLSLRAAASDR